MDKVTELKACPFCGGEGSADGHTRYSPPLDDTTWEDGSPITETFNANCVSCGATPRSGIVNGFQTKAEAISRWNARATPALSVDRGQERYRHKKRGTIYALIGVGCAQGTLRDEDPVVIYRGEDGGLWVRHQVEFSDGRFERLPASPAASPLGATADCNCAARFYGDDPNAHQLGCATFASPLGDEERAREVLLQNIIAKPWSNDTTPAFWRDVRITANEAISAMLAFRSSPASADEGVREALAGAADGLKAGLDWMDGRFSDSDYDADGMLAEANAKMFVAHYEAQAALSPETATTGGE